MISPTTIQLSLCFSASKNLRCFHSWHFFTRKYSKKYNYNLNDLIDWKNKTNLAFGSPRKLTKTGKLRKSKNNDNEQLNSMLATMSAQSSHFLNKKFGEDRVFSEVLEKGSYGPETCFTREQQVSSTNICDLGESPNDFIVKDGNFEGDINDHKGKVSWKQERKTSSNLPENEENFFERLPQSFGKLKAANKEEMIEDEEIVIPVINPIPASKDKKENYKESKKRASESKLKQRTRELPSEPPFSFHLINQVPLFKADPLVDKEMCSKISQFKKDVESMSLRTMPSVKSILSKTMPDLNRFFLNRWREKMIMELGEEGFKAHQDATIKRGVNFHANVMELLSGKSASEIQVMPDNEGHWASLQTAMKEISGVEALEEDLTHSLLLYRGILDCVARYKDVLCVIDWKTSKKPRPLLKNTYDDPLQVAAYMGLVNDSRETIAKLGQVNHGLLVIVYPDGSPAHIHLMNQSVCEQYWQDWCGRLYYYYQLTYTDKFGTT